MSRKRVLVIGASDSSGIGSEADQKVIAAHGCDDMTVTTALRTRKSSGLYESYTSPIAFVKSAVDGCFNSGGVDVVRIGYMASVEILRIVVDALRRHEGKLIIIDHLPVFENEPDLGLPDALHIFQTDLLRLNTVLTLSILEAVSLLNKAGHPHRPYQQGIFNLEDRIRLAEALYSLGPRYVLLRGDRWPLYESLEVPKNDSGMPVLVDILYDGTDSSMIKTSYTTTGTSPRVEHALASAVASNLALGDTVSLATQKACRYVEAAVTKANGAINYFHSTYTLPFSQGNFIEYLLNRADVKTVWHSHVHHDFVKRIGNGTLPIEKFKNYLIQDYLFLVQFARAKALSAYKSSSMEVIAADAEQILHIKREMSLHLDYCAEFGLPKKDVEEQEEHQACTAYTRYVLDIAHSETWFALQIAFAPCLLGYGIIAQRLWDDPATVREHQGNRYWKWIQNYVADDYRAAVEAGEAILEKHAVLQSPSQIEALVKVFVHATKMETGFWDMGNA